MNNMSYVDKAVKIREMLKKAGLNSDKLSDEEKRDLIDAMLWFGQVAKYRCRQNKAYENFSKMVFTGIATVKYVPVTDEYDILKVVDVCSSEQDVDKIRKDLAEVSIPCAICGKIHPEGDSVAHFG